MQDLTKGKIPNMMYILALMCTSRSICPSAIAPWEPPPENYVKLNFDGSYVVADRSVGAGMILRDHADQVIFAACRWLFDCPGPLEAELATCEED